MNVKSSRKGVLSNVSETCATNAEQSMLKSAVRNKIGVKHKNNNSFFTQGTSNAESENKPQSALKNILGDQKKPENKSKIFGSNPLLDLGIITNDQIEKSSGSSGFLGMLSNFFKNKKSQDGNIKSKKLQTIADYDNNK